MAGTGWCPRGRRAEDGRIDEHYPLRETPRSHYLQRTEWNVRDSDATLIVAQRPLTGGTAATERITLKRGKPCLVAHPDDARATQTLRAWITENGVTTLNVAGPRQSSGLDPYDATRRLLRNLLMDD